MKAEYLMNTFGSSTIRLMLNAGEIFNTQFIPTPIVKVRVIRGQAWISHNGRDMVVESGEYITVSRTNGNALISGVQSGRDCQQPQLVVEIS